MQDCQSWCASFSGHVDKHHARGRPAVWHLAWHIDGSCQPAVVRLDMAERLPALRSVLRTYKFHLTISAWITPAALTAQPYERLHSAAIERRRARCRDSRARRAAVQSEHFKCYT